MDALAPCEARRLSELIDRVEAGEEITITRRGKAVARRVPIAGERVDRQARDALSSLESSREGVSLGALKSGSRVGRR